MPVAVTLEGPESAHGTLVGKVFPTGHLITDCGLGRNDLAQACFPCL